MGCPGPEVVSTQVRQQRLEELRPPTLHDLVKIPQYRDYLRILPEMPEGVDLNNPWQVWARKVEAGWTSRLCTDYTTAYAIVRYLLRQTDKYDDVCIVSRSVLFGEPGRLVVTAGSYTEFVSDFHGAWDPDLYPWCARCRRPTVYRVYQAVHRALRTAPVISADEPFRCYYCGARRIFAHLTQVH